MFRVVRTNAKIAAAGAASLLTFALLFAKSGAARSGALFGLILSAQVLIPSLFTFMCVCEFVIRSGFSARAGKALAPLTKFLFNLPGACAAGILMSYLGGYPVGARSAAVLCERGEISEHDARRMLAFTVNAGPAFVVFAVGDTLTGSRKLGLLLLAAHIVPSLLIGVLTGVAARLKKSAPPEAPAAGAPQAGKTGLAEAFVSAVSSACGAMLTICAFVVVFSALSGALLSLPLPAKLAGVFPPFLEITSGLAVAVESGSPWFLAGALSFGGLCVHFQIMAISKKVFPNLAEFLFYRVLHAILSAGMILVLMRFFPVIAETFSNSVNARLTLPCVSVPASAALLAMCVVFLFDFFHKDPAPGARRLNS